MLNTESIKRVVKPIRFFYRNNPLKRISSKENLSTKGGEQSMQPKNAYTYEEVKTILDNKDDETLRDISILCKNKFGTERSDDALYLIIKAYETYVEVLKGSDTKSYKQTIEGQKEKYDRYIAESKGETYEPVKQKDESIAEEPKENDELDDLKKKSKETYKILSDWYQNGGAIITNHIKADTNKQVAIKTVELQNTIVKLQKELSEVRKELDEALVASKTQQVSEEELAELREDSRKYKQAKSLFS